MPEATIPMSEKEIQMRFQWLYPHLEEAGRRLRLHHRNRSYTVKLKKDGSKVTDADVEMSNYWVELLSKAYPGETIVSEELASSHTYPSGSDVVWYVDPIDGTGKFIDGSPNYFVLISICLHGKPGLGILYQPERNCVLYGNPYIRTRLYTSPKEYREMNLTTGWKNKLPLVVKGAQPSLRSRLEDITHLPVRRTSEAVHNIIGPLSDINTGFISFRKTSFWDLAAPAAIMQSSGFHTNIMSRGEVRRYNDGNVTCERFYCLPHDTPDEVIEYISTVSA